MAGSAFIPWPLDCGETEVTGGAIHKHEKTNKTSWVISKSPRHSDLSEAISIEKRYFTSDLRSLSYASLTF